MTITNGSMWLASVTAPKAGVNDPEGEAIRGGFAQLGLREVQRVRAGRMFKVQLRSLTANAARSSARRHGRPVAGESGDRAVFGRYRTDH